MNTILPLLSTIVTLAFAVAVFDQYMARRRAHQLLWAVGLVMYLLGTLMEFLAGALGVSSAILRVWYASGAVLTAAYLGMGTVYLLFPGKGTNVVMVVLVAASAFAVYKVAVSPVDMAALGAHELSGSKAFPPGFEGPRLLTPFFNTFGAVTLVGGAAWSAWSFWRRRIYPHRVVSNILIALGALMPVWGGSMARAGNPSYLYLSELLGVTIIFLGFLRNKEVFGLYRLPLAHGFKRVS